MPDSNKQAALRVLEEAFNNGQLEVIDEIVAADAVDHDPQNPFPEDRGPEAAKKAVSMYRQAFPDLHLTVEAQYEDGDVVITRWSSEGTHEGELMGIPPTHRKGSVTGITIDRFENGKIVETWTNWDTLGLMQNLGVVPEAQPAG